MGTSSETKDELLLIAEQHILDLSNPDDQQPWVALQLFCMNQRQIAEELKDRNFETFVPLEWVVTEKKPGQRVRVLRPVVRNLLFLKAKMPDDLLRKEMSEIKFPVRLLRKSKDSNELAKIPACQMYDFQVMCNPELVGRKIISTEEAKLKKGQPVMVTHGPLKGLKGRLVRASKKYYLLKEIPGISVMLNVSRWCCEPIE